MILSRDIPGHHALRLACASPGVAEQLGPKAVVPHSRPGEGELGGRTPSLWVSVAYPGIAVPAVEGPPLALAVRRRPGALGLGVQSRDAAELLTDGPAADSSARTLTDRDRSRLARDLPVGREPRGLRASPWHHNTGRPSLVPEECERHEEWNRHPAN